MFQRIHTKKKPEKKVLLILAPLYIVLPDLIWLVNYVKSLNFDRFDIDKKNQVTLFILIIALF